MQHLHRIELNGKQLGIKIYRTKQLAQRALSQLIDASEARLQKAFRSGDLRSVNALQVFNRNLRKGLAVASYTVEEFMKLREIEIKAVVEQGNFSNTAQSYSKRLSSVHRKYADI